jgi:hypothetical protein
MNNFADTYNIPMFAYGLGASHLERTNTEHISITEYVKNTEVDIDTLPRIAELIRSSSISSVRSG